MLSSLLEAGHTYRAVARDFSVGHSTVERQVKALLWEVARSTPIAGVPDASLASLNQLRAHAEAVMAAVRSSEPPAEPCKLTDLDEAGLLGGIRRLRRLSQNASRDVALLLVLLATGAKPLEIARLKVQDYLRADGAVRGESRLRDGTAIRGRERVVFFDSERACDAVDVYLQDRLRRRLGATGLPEFRGLDPESALFLTEGGRPFRVRSRGPEDARPTCPVLLATYSAIFRRAGWDGVNTQHVRRLFAQRLAGKGAGRAQLGELLGVRDQRSVKRLLQRPERPLSDLVRDMV
jgi:integrase